MSSYADAAAANAQDKVEKVSEQAKGKSTSKGHANVAGGVSHDDVSDLKKKGKKDAKDAIDKGLREAREAYEKGLKEAREAYEKGLKELRDAIDRGQKEFKEFRKEVEEEGRSIYQRVVKFFKQRVADVQNGVDSLSKTDAREVAARTKEELKNPVVITQALVGLGGLAAGYAVFTERHRINTDNTVVVATHAAIITGLVFVDQYLFNKYYPKYKKQ